MKKRNLLLSTIAITLCMAFVFMGQVKAQEITSANFDFPKKPVVDEPIMLAGTTDEHLSATVTKMYTEGTIESPYEEVGTDGNYGNYQKYIMQVVFAPSSNEYNLSSTTTYTYTGNNSEGHFVSKDEVTGAVTVNFEVDMFYRLKFQTNRNVDIEDQLVKVGEDPAVPIAPDQDGFTFYGWFYDEDYISSFSEYPTAFENSTIYGLYVDNNKLISNINLTLTLPKIATKFTTKEIGGEGYGETIQTPSLAVKSDNNNIDIDAGIVKSGNNYSELFTGTIQNGSTYNFGMVLYFKNGYYPVKNGLTITVNGQKPSEAEAYGSFAVVIYKSKITGKKLANPIAVTKKTKTIKYKKVVKKKQVISPITVKKAEGTLVYKKISGKKNFKVNSKTGKITVKKGTKKGTYKIKVKITAKGNNNYNSKTKTVTVKIKVK